MKGKFAGVQIINSDGAPGSGVSIKVRGANSITAGTAPLYVVDGIPYPVSDDPLQNPLSNLAPGDIENITILKDVASTQTAQDDDLVQFGKHKGRTYKEIHDEFPTYATWVVMTAQEETDASPGLLHLAKYLSERQTATAPPQDPAQTPLPMTDDEVMYLEEWSDDLYA